MTNPETSTYGELGVELSILELSGPLVWDEIGTLLHNPVHIIFDNQSLVDIQIGNNESDVWKTFVAGEVTTLDMRGNHGIASNFTFRKGMTFYARGPTGDNTFRISYTYAA
jgi:hypothetical protein